MFESRRNGFVCNLEVSSTGELFKFHECKVWFYTSGCTVHEKPNRTGRGQKRCLCIAIPILFSHFHSFIPTLSSSCNNICRCILRIDTLWFYCQFFVFIVRSIE